jgi:hypothetical protein
MDRTTKHAKNTKKRAWSKGPRADTGQSLWFAHSLRFAFFAVNSFFVLFVTVLVMRPLQICLRCVLEAKQPAWLI